MEHFSYLISYRVKPFEEHTIPLIIANYENGKVFSIEDQQIDHAQLSRQEIITPKYLDELKTYLTKLLTTRQKVKVYYIETAKYLNIYTNEIDYVKYHSHTSTGFLKLEKI